MVYEDSSVHVKGNLSDFTITTMFQKDFRLRVLTDWDEANWEEIFDDVKVDWALILGQPYSGKTTLANNLVKALGGPSRVAIINPKEIEAQIKSTLGTPEEPFEGKVPQNKIEDAIAGKIKADKKGGKRVTYVFDSFPGQTSSTEFARFAREKIGCPPDFIVSCQVSEPAVIQARHKKRLEVEADLSEEQVEQFRAMLQDYHENYETYIASYAEHSIESGRTKLVVVDTTTSSEETIINHLRDSVAPKVILVNHDKRLPVDAICANLGIKYNFMYISVYQLIKHHMTQGTPFGKRLAASKKLKDLDFVVSKEDGKDEFKEAEYSAAYFDLDLVVELVCHTVAMQRRPYQSFILLEGLCNSARLKIIDDQLSLRFMDELFMIEKHVGEVQAVVGL